MGPARNPTGSYQPQSGQAGAPNARHTRACGWRLAADLQQRIYCSRSYRRYLRSVLDLFRHWLPQIIGYAEAFQDGTLAEAWAETGHSRTSAYYSGELFEQIFGDLHAESMICEARSSLGTQTPLIAELERFIVALKQLEIWIETHVDTATWGKGRTIPSSIRNIFTSKQWCEALSASRYLISAAEQSGYGSKDFRPV